MAEHWITQKYQETIEPGKPVQTKAKTSMAEGGAHTLGPLTINTNSLENFGLGPNFVDLQPIGFGVNGLVVSAVDKARNQRIAAKKIKVESQISCKYALREIRLLCQLKHENIIKVLDVLFDEGKSFVRDRQNSVSNVSQIYTITELLDTNLNVLIAQNLLEAEHIKLITYQLLRGLHYLNSANVIHRDLKPSNLFINCDTLLLKIGDFGLARIIDTTYNHAGHLTADLGTYWYRAPELMISPRSYTSAVDMWSAGCVLAEMLQGKPIFTGANDIEQLRVIIDSVNLSERDWSAVLRVLPNKLLHHHPMTPQRPLSHRLDNLEPAVIDLLEDMLVFDPQKRGTPGEALAHPYLQAYSNPDKEPVVITPFCIESEVDDLPASQLKKIINEETKKRRGRRGLRIPAPSPIDRPKVSSATLSLKPVGEPANKPRVPKSPTVDNLVKEQRRNRRSRLSTSVDLSFISLPSASASSDKCATPPETSPPKAVYATKELESNPLPPCPWKWPKVAADKSDPPAESYTASASIEKSTPTSGETHDSPKESGEFLFRHTVPDAVGKVADVASSPAKRESRARAVRRRRDDAPASVGRMKPKKRGFVDVGGFDEEDFIHLGLSSGTVDERRASDSLAIGGIESCPEKNQADIDRELNRRNKSASIDMTSSRKIHSHHATRHRRGTGSASASSLKVETDATKTNEAGPSRSQTTTPYIEAPRVVTMHLQPPESSLVTSKLSSGDGKKRGSDVGIKIIKSPRSQRRVTCLGFERRESPTTPSERRWSSATFDRSSPSLLPEKTNSYTNLSPSAGSIIDLRNNSASNDRSSSPASLTMSNAAEQQPYTIESRNQKRCSGNPPSSKHESVSHSNDKVVTPVFDLRETGKIPTFSFEEPSLCVESHVPNNSNDIPENEMLLLSSEPYAQVIPDPPADCDDRPESVMSTLSIPALTPPSEFASESQDGITRKVSQTTLFIEDFSFSQESGRKYSPAEQSRCSSSLSIDLSCCVNKEQIKGEEEEKDQAEVSPRKLQEDWEIASQSTQAQKAEFTLSEILGVEDGEPGRSSIVGKTNKNPTTRVNQSARSGTANVCRAEIDLIPYQVMSPDLKPQHCTFTAAPHSPIKLPVELDRKTPITKFEQLSLDRENKMFTSEFHFSEKEPRPTSRNTGSIDNYNNTLECGVVKDELLIDLPTDSHIASPPLPLDMARIPLLGLGRFTQHKSEEDLASPRPFSPRFNPDGQSTRSSIGRDAVDLSDFKQSVKENLSSLKVSIPKDLPEKRRLVKAHSTESVCSEGESSSRPFDHVTDDLMQFSPVGEAVGQSNASTVNSIKESPIPENYHCNHCLYQGNCTSTSCGELGTVGGERLNHKSESIPRDNGKMDALMSSSEISFLTQQQQASGDDGANSKCPSLDELCLSKDLFNERQKMKSCDALNQSEVFMSQEFGPGDQKKARPKSAKN